MNSGKRGVTIDKDILAGAMFLAIAIVGGVMGVGYEVGTTSRVGPGFVPVGICVLMGCLAVGILLPGLRRTLNGTAVGPELELRPAITQIGALVLFGLCVRPLGLLVASVVLVVVANLSRPISGLLETLILAIFLSLCAAALFVWGLGLPMPLLPAVLR